MVTFFFGNHSLASGFLLAAGEASVLGWVCYSQERRGHGMFAAAFGLNERPRLLQERYGTLRGGASSAGAWALNILVFL